MTRQSKYRMQDVSFSNVDEFLDFLPEDELRTVKVLRRIVFDCLPDIREKLSFNVPFYDRHRSICFIWPASVLWGKKKTYEGVRFGFTHGNLLDDHTGFLEKGGRKQVYWHDYRNGRDIDEHILRSYLFEAALVDEGFIAKRKP